MTVSDPYIIDPRARGEKWAVTIRQGEAAITHRFYSPEDAQTFADTAREAATHA